MKIVRSLELDADYVSARLVGTIARIVTVCSMPQSLPFKGPTNGTPEASATARARNRGLVGSSRIGSWLPSYRVKGRGAETFCAGGLVQCRNVQRPVVYSGLGLVTVLTVDLRKGLARSTRTPSSPTAASYIRRTEPLRGDPALVRGTGSARTPDPPGSPPRSTSSISHIRARPDIEAAAACQDI